VANRRRIRAPRNRWRKGQRRPSSWHDCYSTGLSGITALAYSNPWAKLEAPVGNAAQITAREILAGSVDAQYLDKDEVRVDRIVGDIEFWTASEAADGTVTRPPVVRFGFIVEEDSPESSATIDLEGYNLFRTESLELFEWMYLEQPAVRPVHGPAFSDGVAYDGHNIRAFHWQSHLDIRVKRKLGKADRVWLVMSYANGDEDLAQTSNDWLSPVYESHVLRAVLVA